MVAMGKSQNEDVVGMGVWDDIDVVMARGNGWTVSARGG